MASIWGKILYKTEGKNIFFYRFTQEFLPRFVSLLKQFTENFFIPIQVLICFVFQCFFFYWYKLLNAAFPGVKVYNNFTIIMLIIRLLLLPVKNIGKDFRCSLWIPCLLLSPFHPKNTWYTHVTCYADIGVFTRVIILQVVSKENGCLLPFGFPFRKHWCWLAA